MRKLTIIFLLLTSGYSYGQLLTLGPKVGVNFSTQTGSQYEIPATNFMFGAVMRYEFTRYFELQAEFLFNNKGYREEYQGKEVFDELKANYLEIPVLAKYVYNTKLFNYYVGAGVYWAYWSKGRFKSSIDGSEVVYEDYEFVTTTDADGYKDIRNEFGLAGELGFTYDGLGSGILMFGIRYGHALTATNEITPAPEGFTPRKNQVLTISLTYLLFL